MTKTQRRLPFSDNATLLAITSFSLGIIAAMGATHLTAYSLWDFRHASAPTQPEVTRRYDEQETASRFDRRHFAAPARIPERLVRNKSYRNAQIRRQQRINSMLPDTSTRRGIYDHCSRALGLSGTRLTRCVVEWEQNDIEYQLTQSHENR